MRITFAIILSLIYLSAYAQFKTGAKVNYDRELRYSPNANGGFEIVNGDKRFNKALYGGHSAFRIETSDMPEFGFFMPNEGGNLQIGLIQRDKSLWLNDASKIKSTYYPGCRVYEIQDDFLVNGLIIISVLAMAEMDGMIMKIETENVPKETELLIMFGGATNRRFSRNGDLGVDKTDCFELQPDKCLNNEYEISNNQFILNYGQKTKHPRIIEGCFSSDSHLKLSSPNHTETPIKVWNSKPIDNKPILTARFSIAKNKEEFVLIKRKDETDLNDIDLKDTYAQADAYRKSIANTIKISIPDEYMNPLGALVSTAADAIWDDCWMHGAIGWRMPLNGWRAGYVGDCVGWHDKAREHFNNYANSQVTNVQPTIPHPAQDTARNFARAAKIWGTQMYSNGYICRNPNQTGKMHHYDMNQCYVDELLWHLKWTGDWDYAKEIWPLVKRHLEWEKRNYDPNNDGLYDAYASIWASDALYYNSGAVTHASAYNYRANKMVAIIAEKIGEDPLPYQQEVNKILNAINDRLWLSDKGRWSEFIDLMGHQNIHPDPAIWTVYHAIDSEVHDIFQAYQATRYIDTEIPHIPLKADGLNDGIKYETISTTHWFPYSWSINNVAFAEVAHTALAYWQTGRYDKAFTLFKSAVLDGMYMGASPGNIGQISYYDKARGECYRDFGDPVGMYSRALVQGLFGINPDLLNNRLELRPGFPSDWESANIETSDIAFSYQRVNNVSTYIIKNKWDKTIKLDLKIPAFRDQISEVRANDEIASWTIEENIGNPLIKINTGLLDSVVIQVKWSGDEFKKSRYSGIGVKGDAWTLTSENKVEEVYDPQNVLSDLNITDDAIQAVLNGELGNRTAFVKMQQGQMYWWEPIEIEMQEPFTISSDSESDTIVFTIKNNRNTDFRGEVTINNGKHQFSLTLRAGEESNKIEFPHYAAVFGSNLVQIYKDDNCIYKDKIVNWNIRNTDAKYKTINLKEFYNASITDIFDNQYLSPRSPYTTLQIPTQGIGEWCHPTLTANIDDSGLRALAKKDQLQTPFNVPFSTVGTKDDKNIIYTTLWDNYPDSVVVPLQGSASHAYLMMGGSTNHMQCHIPNGLIRINYFDGTYEELKLVNPDNWLPIEQDLFVDDYAFKLDRPAPYRIALKSGIISRDLDTALNINPTEVYGRTIDGGAGIFVDLPLDSNKKLKNITLETLANDVVIGLMSLTLMK
ncbi:DUF4450 domain-containing protein [Carboxylicivirga linearis]|uniref:DUF4450 domain-containing protein n=1 Tax=Carboxylicivirga linearis TaxID=1628157 RepID=A0ABS5JRA2_9BACT|nr:DUF4450 domain-containing protein [Carboxylicivirga linearis]MBS2097409.1 DUF4450 domain-containing protein [Carboxylicivirga linearis]